jgi:undecaprenyl diphosphate synthase
MASPLSFLKPRKRAAHAAANATLPSGQAVHSSARRIPRHLAVIMDGNGRWAQARGQQRIAGHSEGAEALRRLLKASRDNGIPYVTVYAFSAENWQRPAGEVMELMGLLKLYLKREIHTLAKEGVRLRIIGDRSLLAEDVASLITAAEAQTEQNNAFHLTVALSYGSRQEILRAAQRFAEDYAAHPQTLDEAGFERYLYTHDLPPPDLLIRTGGEVRLSNFLLWQMAYTELYFTPVLWPDFEARHLEEALIDYAARERRYGRTSEQAAAIEPAERGESTALSPELPHGGTRHAP